MHVHELIPGKQYDWPTGALYRKLLKYVQLKSTLVITLLYYYAYKDLLVEILVNLLYNLN